MEKLDSTYLAMAELIAKNSYAQRMQVGAIIVKNQQIISDGYNGTIPGFPNICEDEHGKTLPHVLHAEANAILKLSKSTESSEGSTLYITIGPCLECAKLIVQAGVRRVVCARIYKKPEGIGLLRAAGVLVDIIFSDVEK